MCPPRHFGDHSLETLENSVPVIVDFRSSRVHSCCGFRVEERRNNTNLYIRVANEAVNFSHLAEEFGFARNVRGLAFQNRCHQAVRYRFPDEIRPVGGFLSNSLEVLLDAGLVFQIAARPTVRRCQRITRTEGTLAASSRHHESILHVAFAGRRSVSSLEILGA
jgi:hypothetical protein